MNTASLIYRMLWMHLTLLPILLGPVLLTAGHNLNSRVPSSKILDWAPVKQNIALLPMRTRLWPLYVLLLAAAIPCVAVVEELIFRYPIHSLLTGVLLGGVGFGFAHLTSLVSLRVCLYLVVMGWLFVGVYELMGFWAVVLVHASYNLAALGWEAGGKVARRLTWPGVADALGATR